MPPGGVERGSAWAITRLIECGCGAERASGRIGELSSPPLAEAAQVASERDSPQDVTRPEDGCVAIGSERHVSEMGVGRGEDTARRARRTPLRPQVGHRSDPSRRPVFLLVIGAVGGPLSLGAQQAGARVEHIILSPGHSAKERWAGGIVHQICRRIRLGRITHAHLGAGCVPGRRAPPGLATPSASIRTCARSVESSARATGPESDGVWTASDATNSGSRVACQSRVCATGPHGAGRTAGAASSSASCPSPCCVGSRTRSLFADPWWREVGRALAHPRESAATSVTGHGSPLPCEWPGDLGGEEPPTRVTACQQAREGAAGGGRRPEPDRCGSKGSCSAPSSRQHGCEKRLPQVPLRLERYCCPLRGRAGVLDVGALSGAGDALPDGARQQPRHVPELPLLSGARHRRCQVRGLGRHLEARHGDQPRQVPHGDDLPSRLATSSARTSARSHAVRGHDADRAHAHDRANGPVRAAARDVHAPLRGPRAAPLRRSDRFPPMRRANRGRWWCARHR